MKCTCDLVISDAPTLTDGVIHLEVKIVKCPLCLASKDLLVALKCLAAAVEGAGALKDDQYEALETLVNRAIANAEGR